VRYSIRALLAVIAIAAVACSVFALAPVYRIPALFGMVLLMPAPLVVMLKRGGAVARSFALGGLACYMVWLVVGGLPCAAIMAYRFVHRGIPDQSNIQWEIVEMVGHYYPGYVGIYLPWILVPLGGLLGLVTHAFTGKQNNHQNP
jgi:hypothetical protein